MNLSGGEGGDEFPELAVLPRQLFEALGLGGGRPAKLLPPPDCFVAGDAQASIGKGTQFETPPALVREDNAVSYQDLAVDS